jgi:hypothetical protein
MTRVQFSMPDTLFFPLAALLAAALVYLAIDPTADRPPRGPVSAGGRNAEDVTIKGRELSRFLPGESGGLTLLVAGPRGRDSILRLDRRAAEVYRDPRSGPHIVLAEDVEQALGSHPIEVTIEARTTGDFGATTFEADYFAKAGAESGWKSFPLTNDFQPYTFSWFPPKPDNLGYDYIGIRPVAPDKHRMMEIRSVRVRVTGPKGAPPPSPGGGLAPIP